VVWVKNSRYPPPRLVRLRLRKAVCSYLQIQAVGIFADVCTPRAVGSHRNLSRFLQTSAQMALVRRFEAGCIRRLGCVNLRPDFCRCLHKWIAAPARKVRAESGPQLRTQGIPESILCRRLQIIRGFQFVARTPATRPATNENRPRKAC
jgi:hypothetical protein